LHLGTVIIVFRLRLAEIFREAIYQRILLDDNGLDSAVQ
jgi:hypothetical protein